MSRRDDELVFRQTLLQKKKIFRKQIRLLQTSNEKNNRRRITELCGVALTRIKPFLIELFKNKARIRDSFFRGTFGSAARPPSFFT